MCIRDRSGDERSAHLGLLGDKRVHDLDGAPAALGGHADPLEVARGGEGKVHGLVEAAAAQDLTDLAGEALLAREAADMVLGGRDGRLDAAHAPQAQDLLDEVDLAREVGAERGRGDGVDRLLALACRLDRAAEARERALDERRLDGGSAQGVDCLLYTSRCV